MGRICCAFAILLLLSTSSAFAQYARVIEACSRDVVKFCGADRPEGKRFVECTEAHFNDFAEPCRSALVKIATVREACRADIREQCPNVKPSAGRVLLCVKEHFAALSKPCKDAIGRAAERKVRAD